MDSLPSKRETIEKIQILSGPAQTRQTAVRLEGILFIHLAHLSFATTVPPYY